jgi:hypothetical protein
MSNPTARALPVVVTVVAALSCGGGNSRATQASASRVYATACSSYAVGDVSSTLRHVRTLLRDYKRSPQAESAKVLLSKIEQANRDAAKRDAKALAAKRDSALSQLRKKHDDMSEITTYQDPSSPRHVNSRSNLMALIGEKAGVKPILMMAIYYVADDWLFVQSYMIKADSERFTVTPGLMEVERDNGSGQIWEWYTTMPGPDETRMLNAVATSKTATIRYVGQNYYKDRTITEAEKDALCNVLDAYDLMVETQP